MTHSITAFLAGALLVLGTGAAQAADTAGRTSYLDHCAVCHGTGARGDGPMAPVLSPAPPDLTGLAAANGGVFPMGRVLRMIDGRREVLSHGGSMPIFGLLLDGPSRAVLAPDGTEIVASESLVGIAEWLASVQR
ncbi:c-type cytochrome [Alphaproteobacteria bacterium GH1-50]|uniref:C-type cytochrome n=1 Tax=Kangsaoukella pontilimi TaxID=2691042 RepID=A0A7C9MEI2_9RHOB|nr:c-type cytochrome [Kangsaoukella pontilimi]MXQ08851.1 c-type cytochrome [Kangsaoukella pontilimi]